MFYIVIIQVARESALLFNPQADITAIHDSILRFVCSACVGFFTHILILSPEYNVSFFKRFSLVMNALDNKS